MNAIDWEGKSRFDEIADLSIKLKKKHELYRRRKKDAARAKK